MTDLQWNIMSVVAFVSQTFLNPTTKNLFDRRRDFIFVRHEKRCATHVFFYKERKFNLKS